MRKARKRSLGAALTLVAVTLLAMATPTAATANAKPNACQPNIQAVARGHHIGGLVRAVGKCSGGIRASDMATGTPPLLYHGGPVMMTLATGPVVVTPIFWDPSGHPMSSAYKSLIGTYLGDVAAASGMNSNVYSVLNEYSGTNGQVTYNVRLGAAVDDTNPLPRSGCRVASTDRSNIYADGSGYDACLDDAQLQAQIDSVTAAKGLPHTLAHIYVLYLPKHVESCFSPGKTTTSANQCTINYQPSATYCAYHSFDTTSAVYANMPYPIYNSATGFTCGTEVNFGVVESPNGNPDGDVEISPTSHEVAEAITDPDTVTGWYDSSGFEIGDECAYIFGKTVGPAGAIYNQVIAGHKYLTQEEFSNKDFAITGRGCVQAAQDEA